MTTTELYEVSQVRVRHGVSITLIISSVYGNKRRYREQTTEKQRAELSRLRAEFRAAKQDAKRNKYPRFFVETTQERRYAVEKYCKANKISIVRFVNSAIAAALEKVKNQ